MKEVTYSELMWFLKENNFNLNPEVEYCGYNVSKDYWNNNHTKVVAFTNTLSDGKEIHFINFKDDNYES